MAIESEPFAVHAAPVPTPTGRSLRPFARLYYISFLTLFLELTCIRWFGSTVLFLTFFTNLVLMACFLGMSIGCLAAARPRDYIVSVLPLMFASVLLSCVMLFAYTHFGRLLVDVGGQGSPQQVYFGTEYRANDPSQFVIPIEVVASVFFLLITLTFVGLGQELGRAFSATPNRVAAYSANILGSLVGIAAFMLASNFLTPPFLWFAVGAGTCLYFVRRWTALQIVSLIGLLTTIAMTAYWDGMSAQVIWSPYYKITYLQKYRQIDTNHIGHQSMVPVGEWGPGYALPHLLNRDAGGQRFGDVLVIGAGSGNDVRAALDYGAKHVDAVEIDPVLLALGLADHPGRPYLDGRVTAHLDDGRSFLRTTRQSFDLVEYALVDSLALHSAYSNLRLESFLFTEEAFRDVKARLKPGGVFVMSNYYRQGWIVARLEAMAEKVFGTKPIVISLPYAAVIGPGSARGSFTFLLVGNGPNSPVEAIRAQFAKETYFWLNRRPVLNATVNGYGPAPATSPGEAVQSWRKIGPAAVNAGVPTRLPTDDWPFLYLKDASIPALNLRGMAMVAVLSLGLLFVFAPVRTARPDGRMFFLGAGFMLLETKGVVHLALLFGSTWVVNALVFFAILVMILISNLYVLAARPRRLWPYYALLIAALLVNAFVPMSRFLALPGAARTLATCTVVFLPIFFAGVIFAASFRDSRRPDVAFGSNIAGVILGGLSENASLVVGMRSILFIAVAYYLLSAILGRTGDRC